MEGPPNTSVAGSYHLAGAFSDFIAASTRLEASYRELQSEVAQLSLALSDQNRALLESQSENRALGHRLEHILENVPCGVLVMDEDGCVRMANPEAARLLGRPADQELRLEWHARAAAADGDEQELSFETAEGQVWVALRRVLLPAYSSGAESGTESVLTLRDISSRKRMEEEREAARDTVALAQLSALLAHEIRNPLASLELFAGLLEEQPEGRQEWLSHLRAGIRSLSSTVNNVLTLHGNATLLLESVDVAVEAMLVVDFMQPTARQGEVDLHFVEEAPLEAEQAGSRVRGNRSAFHQVLINLCNNALRHTPRGGSVEVRWHAPPRREDVPLRISVSDTGCGICAEHLPRLFEVGFSGSGATSGLGLAVCERLLRQMGGALRVQSRVGHGSTFTLELAQA